MKKAAFLLLLITVGIMPVVKAQKTAYTMPEVTKILKGMHQYIDVELDDTIKSKVGFINSSYLIPLINYIDYNEIGKGRVATINEDKLREFIINQMKSGIPLRSISRELITE